MFEQTIWLVPCYALIGMMTALLWSPGGIRSTGPRPAGYINIMATCLGFVHSAIALGEVWQHPPRELHFTWLQAAGLEITFDLEISAVSVGAITLITGLNILAQIFAVGYLEMDWGWARFYALMGAFEAGLCGLVLCDSLFFSYVYLEILTLGTYLIIGYWFAQPLVITGARDAFWTKRVGDLLLLAGVIALYPLAGTWNYGELAAWAQTTDLEPAIATLLCVSLIAGPVAKGAQLPLQLWLDEAMEGPIPASVIRNAVVVASGAYVLIKLRPVFEIAPTASAAIAVIGAVTAVTTSLIAIAQIDIKRVLSYTTNAYMGLVFIAIGLGQEHTALLLILTHSLAIALLYMSSGSIVINAIAQDITLLGGLWSRRPLPAMAFLIGMAGLIAVPPLGGYWGLLQLLNEAAQQSIGLLGAVIAVNVLLAFALGRAFALIFGGAIQPMSERCPEVLWAMVLPTAILSGFALHLPLILATFNLLPEWTAIAGSLSLVAIASGVTGGALGIIWHWQPPKARPARLVPEMFRELLTNDLYIQRLYRLTIAGLVDITAKVSAWIDRYIVDGAINILGIGVLFGGQALRYSTTGQSQLYITSILLSLVAIALLLSFPFLN